jgi:DNA-binding Lrp family transcriptional regulator
MVKLDLKDRKILNLLRKNSKLTSQQISRKTLIPITTIHNRIKKMEREGVIKGYTVILDHKKLGKGILAFILITVSYIMPDGKKISQAELAKKISRIPEVEEVHIVTGGTDIIIKVRVRDMDELNRFVIDDLRSLDGVENTQTIIALSSPGI